MDVCGFIDGFDVEAFAKRVVGNVMEGKRY